MRAILNFVNPASANPLRCALKEKIMKAEYKTKQKNSLIGFLKANHSRQFSINEICEAVKSNGIGKSTVYRNISHLCEEGAVRRFRGEGGKSVLYQYVGKDSGCDSHFHLKCTACGRLIHLDCKDVMRLKAHINAHHNFSIDIAHTVFYGLCGGCKALGGAE